MIIVFPDINSGSATSSAPTFHIVDTSAGLLQFVSGGASTVGTVVFAGATIFTPPSIAVWQLMQSEVARALINGSASLSFVSAATAMVATSFSPSPVSASGGGTVTIIGTGFQQGLNATLDYNTGGSVLQVLNLGVATVVNQTQITITFPTTIAGNYPLTLVNPDGSFTCITITSA